MKVLVLGATGMLGHKLLQRLGLRFDVIGTVRGDASDFSDHLALKGYDLIGGVNVEDEESVARAIAAAPNGVVVNAIGLIKQLPEATHAVRSITVNALHPHRAAALARGVGARFIHISTDCVFSGRKGAYTESDPPDPEDLYGRTKLLGEVAEPGCFTLRSSIVGRELATKSGLFEWCIGQRGGSISGYDRAIFTGLTTLAMSDMIGDLIESHGDLSGIWHVSSEPISKFDLLTLLNNALNLGITIHRDQEFVNDRSLDSRHFREATGFRPPPWSEMVESLAADTTPYDSINRGIRC